MLENVRDLVRTDILWPIAFLRGQSSLYEAITLRRLYKYIVKRGMDIFFSTLALIAVSPLMLIIAILIKLDSKGPIFYSQVRVGQNRRRGSFLGELWGQTNRRRRSNYGANFRILKFRSMRTDAEVGNKPQWCTVNDPRVTRFGNILRKSHLDELPQLINILRGDMTFVGPRPERPEFVSDLVTAFPHYALRLRMKPGLTGLAQIYHRPDLSLDDVRRKLRYDHLYSKSLSLATDVKIVFGTIPMVLGVQAARGAKPAAEPALTK